MNMFYEINNLCKLMAIKMIIIHRHIMMIKIIRGVNFINGSMIFFLPIIWLSFIFLPLNVSQVQMFLEAIT